MQERELMEYYDSRPKVKLFSFKDAKEETQDLFFASMKAMWTLGVIAGLILGGLLSLLDPFVGILTGSIVIAGIGFGSSYFNERKKRYFEPLIHSMQEKLAVHEISLSMEEIRYLISQKEHRISPKNVLAVWSNNKEISVFLIKDVKEDKPKEAKTKEFKVEVLSENPVKEKEENVKSKAKESSPAKIETEEVSSPDVEFLHIEEAPSEEAPVVDEDSQVSSKTKVKVTAFASQHASVDAVSTNAIDIVSPPSAEVNTEKSVTAPRTGVIGLIAPGVTGPIPITVGDHSVPYTGVVDSADGNLDPVRESVSSSVMVEAPLRRPRHGRRRATPSNQE